MIKLVDSFVDIALCLLRILVCRILRVFRKLVGFGRYIRCSRFGIFLGFLSAAREFALDLVGELRRVGCKEEDGVS